MLAGMYEKGGSRRQYLSVLSAGRRKSGPCKTCPYRKFLLNGEAYGKQQGCDKAIVVESKRRSLANS